VFLPAPQQMTSCTPSFSEKIILPLLKMTSRLVFQEDFLNKLSGTNFINSEFTILKIKKICSENNILK